MKQDRKPEYGKKDTRYRIVSRPNCEWAVQEYYDRQPDANRKTVDLWQDLIGASRLSYEEAQARLAGTQP